MDTLSENEMNAVKAILDKNGYKVEKKGSSGGCCLYALIIILLFVFVFVVFVFTAIKTDSNYDYTSKESVEKGSSVTDKLQAYRYAMGFVKEKLKSPSSAKFPDSQRKVDDTRYMGDNTYKIDSYVESMNSFGTMIRTDFSCTIKFDNGSVYCNNLIIY